MRVHYKGKTSDYNYRIAEILFDEYNEKEEKKVNEIVDIMENWGWEIDTCVAGFYIVEVEDKSEFEEFMRHWKEAKKEVLQKLHK